MKKTIYIIITSCTLCACTKFLDIKPYGETIPETADEFSALLHSHLEDIDEGEETIAGNINSSLDVECYADNLEANLTSDQATRFLSLYVGSYLSNKQSLYRNLYSVIRDCNIVIENIEEKESRLAKDVLGTAYAMRGICYYNLLRNFCEPCYNNLSGLGVPLVVHFDMEATPKRSTIEQTVRRIEDDFKAAISYDITDPVYRFNSDIMEGWLARLYFWAGDYGQATVYAEKVLAKYPLLNREAFNTMMGSLYTKTPVTEMLFKSCIQSGNSQDYNAYISNIKGRPVSARFVKLFEEKEKDIRYTISFNNKRENIKNPYSCLRSGEMQLILAESFYHQGKESDALAALNELRRNRISEYTDLTMETLPSAAPGLITTDVKGNPLTPLLSAILCERQKELYMEGDRWFELKRNGRPEFWAARQGRKYTTMKFMYTFPIPINDTDLVDGLIQNPGYDKVQ